MAVLVKDLKIPDLLDTIKQSIDKGEIQTWTYDKDGDFTHCPEQWKNKAWFRAKVIDGELQFNIIPSTRAHISKEVYGVYHGRFSEMLLTHFDKNFGSVSSTALPSVYDRI